GARIYLLVHRVMEMPDETMQRLVAKDVDRVAVAFVARRLHVDGALVAANPGAGLAHPDDRLAEVGVAGPRGVFCEDPGNRAADRTLVRNRVDGLCYAAARRPDYGTKAQCD